MTDTMGGWGENKGPSRIFKGLGIIYELVKSRDTNFPVILSIEKGRSAYVRSICLKCLTADISTMEAFKCKEMNGPGFVASECGGYVLLISKNYDSASHISYRLAMQKVNQEVHRIQTDEIYRAHVLKLAGSKS